MRPVRTLLLVCLAVSAPLAQTSDPVLSDKRLTVHTLLREDVFAGFRNDNLERLARAEQNIEILLNERPEERANLLAWKAGTATYHAVRAHEAGQPAEFDRRFAEARDGFASAAKLNSSGTGVPAITAGTMAVFADRLPEKHRPAAWAQAYDNYTLLWRQQGATIEKLPVHFKGELLSGLTQSAQRTGRSEEATQYLDKMLTMLAETPYETMARAWKADPASAAKTNLTCKNCHNPGRLSSRLEALKGEPK